jgi:hypothetical protein
MYNKARRKSNHLLYFYNKKIHIYKYFQSHHKHISITPATITSVPYNNNIINIQLIIQKCTIKTT